MKVSGALFVWNILAMALGIGAIVLSILNISGWGWFLGASVIISLIHSDIQMSIIEEEDGDITNTQESKTEN